MFVPRTIKKSMKTRAGGLFEVTISDKVPVITWFNDTDTVIGFLRGEEVSSYDEVHTNIK